MAKKLISIDDSKTGEAALPEAVNAALRNTYAPASQVAAAKTAGLLRAAAPSTRANVKTVIGAFEAGHGWTASGGGLASSDLNHTEDFFLGTQSVKVTSSTAGTAIGVKKTGLTLDATGSDIRIWFKYDNAAALQNMQILIGSTDLQNRYTRIVLDLSTTNTGVGFTALPGDWGVIDVPFDTLAVMGTPNRSAIEAIQITITPKSGQVLNAWVGGVALVPRDELNRWPNGVVTLTFDDSYTGQWTIAKPYMDARGIRGTFFPIAETVGGAYFTMDNLKALRDQGHEIGAHATSIAAHTSGIASLTQAQRIAELEQLRQWQIDNGFNSTSYAYPNGDWSRAAAIDVGKYFESGRLAFANFPGGVRPEDQFRVRAVNGATQQASLNSFVDQIKASRGWLNVVFHNIVDTGASGNNISTANFKAFIDYVLAQGVPIRTQGEVISLAR